MKVKVKLPELERRDTGLFDVSAGIQLGAPELREDAAFPKIKGYAAVFNQLSDPLFMGVREKIRPGAFKRTLAEGADVRALVDHDPSRILGRNRSGTLRLQEDSHGLRYEIDPPNTTVGRDIMESLRRKDVNQSSFGFRVKEEEYNLKNESGQKTVIRELIDVDLFDVSIVTYPAYPQTSVSVRSLWPNMDELVAKSGAEAWYRDIKNALEPPPQILPQYERRLRLRRLELLGEEVKRSSLAREDQDIQSVVFARASWSPERALNWLNARGLKADQSNETSGFLRFVQFDASEGDESSFATMTENMPRGVRMVVCKKKSFPVSAGSAQA